MDQVNTTQDHWAGWPGWLSGLVQPSAQGMILEIWDQVPRRAPCMEPASASACFSASLSLSVSHDWKQKIKKKRPLGWNHPKGNIPK